MRAPAAILTLLLAAAPALAGAETQAGAGLAGALPDVQTPEGVSTILQWVLIVTVLSVAPAIVLMVTCFTRIIVVLGLLRQALATQQLPPNSVLFALAVLMTLVVMAPVYADVYGQAVGPYLRGQIPRARALEAADGRVRGFMIDQIERAGNARDVYLFLPGEQAGKPDLQWAQVPTLSLIPAYAVSELKVAFFMGFQFYLPFVVIDMLVAAVLVSMGMLMLPPVLISLPFKLLLFVLADGWHRVVGTLMQSFS